MQHNHTLVFPSYPSSNTLRILWLPLWQWHRVQPGIDTLTVPWQCHDLASSTARDFVISCRRWRMALVFSAESPALGFRLRSYTQCAFQCASMYQPCLVPTMSYHSSSLCPALYPKYPQINGEKKHVCVPWFTAQNTPRVVRRQESLTEDTWILTQVGKTESRARFCFSAKSSQL